ncbi:asb-2 [Pristionchus pacificus]|uniref:ATP synthase subunit b n=1 Tax=Pristionchus pacificus TaxID=54126 RepID=A0A454Y653_PRIPA|nr:asb-2 [Pristionchus pacificus]|eukprot:PDM64684.1 asb-2 [Pristionchus pacificus]
MSLSRMVPAGKAAPRLVVVSARSAHHAHSAAPAASTRPEELDNPNFFQKISLRFQGIPLKGETAPPKSMFDDCGKEWSAPQPLPPVPADFKEHPDRDLTNFPYPSRPMYAPKTRMLMIPDSWLTPFHKVTGTSGPYLFVGGLAAFLVNKELWVFEEQGHMTVGWILFYLLISRTVGFRLDQWLYGEYQNRMGFFKNLIEEDLKEAKEFRKNSALESDSLVAVKEAFPTIFKENMVLQLEATYRKNVQTVATEMKRRLDYLKETEETKRRFERDVMLKFISEGVEAQAADPKFKEQYINDAISQLKGLSPSQI